MNLEEFVASLSESERSCVDANTFGGVEILRSRLEFAGLSILHNEKALVDCLDDESVNILVTAGSVAGLGPLSAESSTCISSGLTGLDLHNVLSGADEGALMVNGMLAQAIVLSCLNDEEWPNANYTVRHVDVVPADQERVRCMLEHFGSPEELAEAFRPVDGHLPEPFFLVMGQCGVLGVD